MKTRDGKDFSPGMVVWLSPTTSLTTEESVRVEDDILHVSGQEIRVPINQLYSTSEAAVADLLQRYTALLQLTHSTLANLVITLEGELSRDKPGPKLNIQGSHGDSLGA